MPVPRTPAPHYNLSDDWTKVYHIIYTLTGMDYECVNARDIIKIIDDNNLDKSQFDFPCNSYDEFKQCVRSGKYDVDRTDVTPTKEYLEQLQKDVDEGRLWVTY